MEMILEDRRIPAPHDHGLGELLAVKMAIILITTYQFNETPIKIPIPLFTEIGKSILKFIGKHRKLWNVKATLRQKKVNVRGITLPNFNCSTELLQGKGHGASTDRRTDPNSHLEYSEAILYSHSHMISDKDAKKCTVEKAASSTDSHTKMGYLHKEEWN